MFCISWWCYTVYYSHMDHHYVPVTYLLPLLMDRSFFLSFFFFFHLKTLFWLWSLTVPCHAFKKCFSPLEQRVIIWLSWRKKLLHRPTRTPLTRKQLRRALDSSLKCHWCKNRCNGLACFRAFWDISMLIPYEYQSLCLSHSSSIILFQQTNTDLSNLVQSVVWWVLDIHFAQPELY